MNNDEGEQYYRNAPRSVQFAMRFAAMLIIVVSLTALAKGLSWALGTNFSDMLILSFAASFVLRDIKRSIHK